MRSFSIPSPARSPTPGSLMGERAPQICARQSEPVADTVARLLSSVTAGNAGTEPVQEAALTLQEAVEEARRERAGRVGGLSTTEGAAGPHVDRQRHTARVV